MKQLRLLRKLLWVPCSGGHHTPPSDSRGASALSILYNVPFEQFRRCASSSIFQACFLAAIVSGIVMSINQSYRPVNANQRLRRVVTLCAPHAVLPDGNQIRLGPGIQSCRCRYFEDPTNHLVDGLST